MCEPELVTPQNTDTQHEAAGLAFIRTPLNTLGKHVTDIRNEVYKGLKPQF